MDIHIRNAIMYGIICKTLYNQAAHCRCACECEKEKDLGENIVKVEMTSTTKSAWVRMVFFCVVKVGPQGFRMALPS